MKELTNKAQFRFMRNVALTAAAAFSLVFVSCHDYDHEIADLEDRLEMIESITIPGINQQIVNINNSITELQLVDQQLDIYIKNVEATAADLQKQLDATNAALAQTNADLATAKQEIAGVKANLASTATELKNEIANTATTLRNELLSLKSDLEVKLAAVNTELEALKAKDVELDGKIAALQNYVDNDLKKYIDAGDAAVKDWANATFETLTKQYQETQTEISSIKALIQKVNEDMAAMETRLNSKIDNDVNGAMTTLRAEIEALKANVESDYNAKLTALEQKLSESVTTVTDGYKAAVADAKTEITGAYTAAIASAITTSEAGMKVWVDSTLADGYYKKAEVDAQLALLDTLVNAKNDTLQNALNEAKADLQKQLDDQKTALDNAQASLTEAYKQAIEAAIATNNGIIEGKIADAANEVRTEVNTKLTVIDGKIADINAEIQKLWDAISEIKEKIASIEEQIANINKSIKDLGDMDKQLDGYIKDLQATAADLQKQLDDTNLKIDNVKKEMGDEIDALEQNLLSKLEATKNDIQKQIDDINNTITELQAKDAALEAKIDALKTYVENDLKNYIDAGDKKVEDWATATFATLVQYDAVQQDIAAIKVEIATINTNIATLKTELEKKIADDIKAAIDALRTELNADYVAKIQAAVADVTTAYTVAIAQAKTDIEAAYTAAISTAIATSEAGMKQWVNETLANGYYKAAEIDAMLAALKNEVSQDLDDVEQDILAKIAAQETALEKAKTDLTTAYTKAINDAITANNGVIDQKIKDAVDAAQAALQSQIDAINAALDALQKQVDELEKNFTNRIQSVSFVPQYSDGKVKMDYATRKSALDFLISPANLATTLKDAWDADNKVITAYVRYTSDPTTRAAGEIVQLDVTAVTADASGMISVSVAENSSKLLSTDFWKGDVEAVVYIQISDGNNNIISDMIPMIAHGYVSSAKDINGFGDGQTGSGQVLE